MERARRFTVLLAFAVLASRAASQDLAAEIRERYEKREVAIPMRDGVKLYTAIYAPKDLSDSGALRDGGRAESYPILLIRTPYSCQPYGADEYRTSLGPSEAFV